MKIDELKKTLAKLEANLVTASNKSTALQTERRKIAFSAYSGGDGRARTALDELNTSSAIANLENENARAAIDECRRQLATAEIEWEANAPKRREAARQAREILEEAETVGEVMAEGLDRLCEGFAAFSACLEKLERFGYPVATSRLRYLAYTRAVQSRLHQAGLGFDVIAPYLRHDLASLNASYTEPARNKAAEDLGEAIADAEAA